MLTVVQQERDGDENCGRHARKRKLPRMRIASLTLLFAACLSRSDAASQTTFPDVTPQATQRMKAAGFEIEVYGDLKGDTRTRRFD